MKLRKWVVGLLVVINIICFLLLGSDTSNLGLFIISKVILLGIVFINTYILNKYSNIFKDNI